MNETKRHIAYLLESRGFAEIPGIGSFSRHHRSATFEGLRLMPPADIVSFSYLPDGCDSVELQHSIMRATGMDSEQAFARMTQDIGDIHRELNVGNSSDIERVGTLQQSGDSIAFSPAAQDFATFDYPVIELHDIKKKKEDSPRASGQITELQRETFMRSLSRTASAAAAIAVFILVTFVVSQLPGRHSIVNEASFAVDPAPMPVATAVSGEPVKVNDASLILIFNTPADASSPVEYVTEEQLDEQKRQESRYCLVVASLANKAEADKYMAYAPEGLSVLEKDGRYRVYVLEASTAEELTAKAEADGIYKTYPSAWVCRK